MSREPAGPPDSEGDPGHEGVYRFEAVSRRAFLRRGATAAGAAAVLGLAAACGHDDASVFAATDSGAGAASTTLPATTVVPGTSSPGTSSPETSAPETTSTTEAPQSTLAGELTVEFTYAAGSGQFRNPYVAAWIEDADGALVDTLAVWWMQTQKGTRWLSELRRWMSVDGSQASIDAVSGATRTPGDYALVWDLTDLDGRPADSGQYYVCIEAAREHGPYSLIREPVTLAGADLTTDLTSDGELTDATIAYSPA